MLKIKSALGELGHYQAPEWGVTQFPDAALFAALEKFQRANRLKVDGVMKPGGPTEEALQSTLTTNQTGTALHATARALQDMGRNGDEILAHITPEEAQLLHDVTDGGSINSQTGLVEFWFGFGGNDDTKSYQSAVSKAAKDQSLSDKDFWSGYESSTSAYDKANSDGVHHDHSGKSNGTVGNNTPGGGGTASNDPDAQSINVAVAKQVQRKAPRKSVVTTPDDDPAFSSGFLTKKAVPTLTVGLGFDDPAAPAKPLPTAPPHKQSDTTGVGMGLTSGADPRTQPGPVSAAQQVRNIEKAEKIKEQERIQDQKAADVGEQLPSPQTPSLPTPGPAKPVLRTSENGLLGIGTLKAAPVQSRNLLSNEINDYIGAVNDAYIGATSWHFEKRDLLNSPLPSSEAQAKQMGFTLSPDSQSIFHQNQKGASEKKFVHENGREVVFDGDTGKVVTDPRYRGTYNYEVPASMPKNLNELEAWRDYLSMGSGHLLLDVAPYGIGGNNRGSN